MIIKTPLDEDIAERQMFFITQIESCSCKILSLQSEGLSSLQREVFFCGCKNGRQLCNKTKTEGSTAAIKQKCEAALQQQNKNWKQHCNSKTKTGGSTAATKQKREAALQQQNKTGRQHCSNKAVLQLQTCSNFASANVTYCVKFSSAHFCNCQNNIF